LREKFPEKVPFRLTRMLQKAMGVAGINGLYRTTCESVLRILRNNRESLLAVLETFAHDPIISWRITLDKNDEDQKSGENPFPDKDKKKDLMIGSIMGGL
jgi:FKBP12-rapamycin complex-associated protein